jgi:TatA/E family protein of Tat protein translocase
LPHFQLRQYDEHMSFSETIFLFVLALVIFGPKKLPEIARQVGRVLNDFRRASNEFKSQIEREITHLEVESTQKILPSSEAPAGITSRSSLASTNESGASQSATEVPEASHLSAEPPGSTANVSESQAVSASSVAVSESENSSSPQGSHA